MILKIIAKENEQLFFFKSNTCIMTSDRVCLEIKKKNNNNSCKKHFHSPNF